MAPALDERSRLGGALIELCFERGFPATGREALLERAGLAPEAFDRHFGSLEDCFLETLEAVVDCFRREAVPLGGAGWRERIRGGAYAFFRFLVADEHRSRFILVESPRAGERTLLFTGRLIEVLSGLIDEGRRELADPCSLSWVTAELLVGGIFTRLYAIVGSGVPLPPEEKVVPELMYIIVLPYLGPAAAQEELLIPPPPLVSKPRSAAAGHG